MKSSAVSIYRPCATVAVWVVKAGYTSWFVSCISRGPRGPWVAHLRKKVKGHSGANNREPHGHKLNNFGRGPFDNVIYEI